jgi:nucleotide-binding universal stress UspA family protein
MHLLVAHDGSDQAGKALNVAADIAARFGGRLTVVTVVPDLCLVSEEIGPEACEAVALSLKKDAEAAMKKATDQLADRGVRSELVVKEGRPADMIMAAAREAGADLVVIGSHGKHGAAKFLLGSVSAKVAEHAGMSVLIVR